MKNIKSVYGEDCEKIGKIRRYKSGYVLQREFINYGLNGNGFWMTVAYTHNGDYLGDSKTAYRLCAKRGIAPVKRSGDGNVCSIGYCEKEKKWYGWSHRAIYGFKIGDVVKEGDCCASSGWTDEYLKDHPDQYVLPVGFIAKTKEDTKKMAIAFASSVG